MRGGIRHALRRTTVSISTAAMRGCRGVTPEFRGSCRRQACWRGQPTGRIVDGESVSYIVLDSMDQDGYRSGIRSRRDLVELVGARTSLGAAAQGRSAARVHADLPPGGAAVHRQGRLLCSKTSPPRR